MSFSLGNLIGVMRKPQVTAASVEVQGLVWLKVGLYDSRAFDMPSGTAFAPRAMPIGLTGLAGFPERKIGLVSLVSCILVGRVQTSTNLVCRALQLAIPMPIALELLHIEVDVPTNAVSISIADNLFNVVYDLREVLADPEHPIRSLDVQRIHLMEKSCFPPGRELPVVHLLLSRPCDDLVIDVSDVHPVAHGHFEPVLKGISDRIKGDVASSVSKMTMAIDCRSARVP